MPPIAGTLVRYKILRSYAAPASGARWSDGKMPVGALGNLVKYRPGMFRWGLYPNFRHYNSWNQFWLARLKESIERDVKIHSLPTSTWRNRNLMGQWLLVIHSAGMQILNRSSSSSSSSSSSVRPHWVALTSGKNMLKTRDCINGINIPISEQLVSVACCALPQRRRVLAAAGHFDSGNLCERRSGEILSFLWSPRGANFMPTRELPSEQWRH